ncbi:MAG TPA: hypothetical protein VN633_11725 [Bryobacteraceae bacterium]|nr:hypothetical protein [Bryobacteraceae bacterium]
MSCIGLRNKPKAIDAADSPEAACEDVHQGMVRLADPMKSREYRIPGRTASDDVNLPSRKVDDLDL